MSKAIGKLTEAVCREAIEAVEGALRDGFAPPLTQKKGRGRGSAVFEAARRVPAAKGNRQWIERRLVAGRDVYGIAPDWSIFAPPKPESEAEADLTDEQVAEIVALRRQVTAKNRKIVVLERTVKAQTAEALDAEAILGFVAGHGAADRNPPQWVVEPDTSAKGPGTPTAILSDLHWGEVVRPEEVLGVNEYNLAVARNRLYRWVERVLDLAFNHTVSPDYPGFVLMLGGDMITGHIHPELMETNEVMTAPALVDLEEHLIAVITILAERFGRVFIVCVPGNHGRDSVRPQFKGRHHRSYEFIMYCHLARHFRDDDRVTVHIPDGSDAHFSVQGHRYLLTHGDTLGVKGGDGIIGALGPIMRGRVKVGLSEAQIGHNFDTLVIGHWHQYLALPGLIVNDTMKGYDEFARLALRAPARPASQAFWFTHPKRGPIFHNPVFLADHKRATPAPEEWVTYPGGIAK